MLINWSQFTPWSGLAGGMVIGMAVALLVLVNGRVAGISGVIGGLFKIQKGDIGWRLAFISGLVASPLVWQFFMALPAFHIEGSYVVMAMAGLIVGIGTRYGSGCTSGHGVCGISRLSPRSVIATLLFMVAGFGTVYLTRHILGL